MAYLIGPRDDARGEPSRTALRWLFLMALDEAVPDILGDLWDSCMEPARKVLRTAGPGDRPEHLLTLTGIRRHQDLEQQAGDAVSSPLSQRMFERARAGGELWEALVEWASGYRLTDGAGSRNGWLLVVAADSLRSWAVTYPTTVVARLADLRWALPGARVVGVPTWPAPEFRQRQHRQPGSGSRLGPLARDFLWLVKYVCTQERRDAFADSVAPATVVQRVQRAARLIGFTLPRPMRPRGTPKP